MKIIVFALMIVVILAVSGCVDNEGPEVAPTPTPDVQATVEASIRGTQRVESRLEATVEARVAATLTIPLPPPTPIPTGTPRPKKTPFPTATLYPTATPFPTATLYPTPTLFPKATTRPTNTPAPTATAVVDRPTPTPATSGTYGGTVNMSAYADSRGWDPKGSSWFSSILGVSQLYNQIVQYDTVDTSLIVCDLCESWEVTDGGTTFTFKIQDGVQWLDGMPLTSADVHNSMLRYGDLDSKMGRSGLWRQYTLEASNGGVNLIDDSTVEFNLKFVSGAFIKFLALDYVKVLPKHLLDRGIDLNLAENVIDYQSGSGPFVLDEYQRGSFYRVSRNPNYFKEGRPFFDAIDHTIIVDSRVLIAQFRGGQIDMSNGGFTNMTPTQVFELERDTDGQYRGVAVQPTVDLGLMLNIKKEPFNDARVRQAIQLAIDYQQWNDLVFDNTSGVGCPLMGLAHTFEECLTWPGLRPKDTPEGQADIEMAKQLMADAGYPNGFETRMDVRLVDTYPEQCSVIKQQLERTLNVRVTDFETYTSAAGYNLFATSRPQNQAGDWELACQGEGQVVLDVDDIIGGVYLKGATRNYTDWENDQVNAWHEQQKQETDPGARREINKEVENFLFSQVDNHWITLGWGVYQWVIGEQINNFHAPQTVQTHFKHEDLWLER